MGDDGDVVTWAMRLRTAAREMLSASCKGAAAMFTLMVVDHGAVVSTYPLPVKNSVDPLEPDISSGKLTNIVSTPV